MTTNVPREIVSAFSDHIHTTLSGYVGEYTFNVVHVEDMREDVPSDLFTRMFRFEVRFKECMITDLVSALNALEVWTARDATMRHGKHEYTLGDGDDAGAVTYDDGAVRIWLRSRRFK